MKLEDFNAKQLARIYRKLYSKLPYGGPFGWDAPTLRMTYPGIYQAMVDVNKAYCAKESKFK